MLRADMDRDGKISRKEFQEFLVLCTPARCDPSLTPTREFFLSLRPVWRKWGTQASTWEFLIGSSVGLSRH